MRVSDYFNSGKWPQLIVNTLNAAFILLVFNQITLHYISLHYITLHFYLPLWRYTATKKNTGAVPAQGGRFF
jgi:hypothetical protein